MLQRYARSGAVIFLIPVLAQGATLVEPSCTSRNWNPGKAIFTLRQQVDQILCDSTVKKTSKAVIRTVEAGLRQFKESAEKILAKDPTHLNSTLLTYVDRNWDVLDRDPVFIEKVGDLIDKGIKNSGDEGLTCPIQNQGSRLAQLKILLRCFSDRLDQEVLFTTWGQEPTAKRGQFNSYIDLVTRLLDPKLSWIDPKKLPPFPGAGDEHTVLLGIVSRVLGPLSMLNGYVTRLKIALKENDCSRLDGLLEGFSLILNQTDQDLTDDTRSSMKLTAKLQTDGYTKLGAEGERLITSLVEVKHSLEKARVQLGKK